jgi:hypothetical protein
VIKLQDRKNYYYFIIKLLNLYMTVATNTIVDWHVLPLCNAFPITYQCTDMRCITLLQCQKTQHMLYLLVNMLATSIWAYRYGSVGVVGGMHVDHDLQGSNQGVTRPLLSYRRGGRPRRFPLLSTLQASSPASPILLMFLRLSRSPLTASPHKDPASRRCAPGRGRRCQLPWCSTSTHGHRGVLPQLRRRSSETLRRW